MALISEVADKIYEIKPEGKEHKVFPLCTVYLIVDDKTALVEVGSSVQIPDILDAVGHLGYDIKELSYFATMTVEGYRQCFKRKNLI